MSILADIHAQVVAAMKARENDKRDALRLLENALKTESKNPTPHDLTPDEEITILTREAKKRNEAIESYKAAGAEDRAQKEAFELAIIQSFLPQPLSADEVRDMIKKIVADQGISSKKDFGKVMQALNPQIKGRFPGKDVKPLFDEIVP